jgi:hypothetical protein
MTNQIFLGRTSVRSVRGLCVLVLGLGLSTGCDTLPAKNAVATPAPPVLGSGNFAFLMGAGSAWHGFDVVRVGSKGECSYTFSELNYDTERVIWRAARFEISRETLLELKEELNEVAFFSMEDQYKGPAEAGSTQWFFKVRIGKQQKSVFLDNEFPLQAMKLEKFVSEKVLDPHRAEFKTATVIPAEVGAKAQNL